MKKIYSFMLMATMLLIGINAKAAILEVPSADYATLKAAFDAASAGDEIKLVSNITSNEAIHIYDKSITLNLNGDTILSDAIFCPFYLYKGDLNVTGAGEIRNSYSHTDGPQVFMVYGSFVPATNYSHLTIGENVSLVVPNGPKGRGIHVQTSQSLGAQPTTDHPSTGILGSGHGFAFGVVVDVYGDITVTTTEGYCVQVSGRVRHPHPFVGTNYTWGSHNQNTDPISDSWATYAPKINLYNTCLLKANDSSTGAAAMYAAGYAIWNIQCTAEGSCALAAKSGQIAVTNATLHSTASSYEPVESKTSASGIDTKGSAVVIETNKAYSGYIDITFAEDTKIIADAGFAVEESITTANTDTKVSAISIQGGNFQGGNDPNAGCLVISQGTAENATITIGGGSYTAQTEEQQTATQTLLETLLGNNTPSDPAYTIEVNNGGASQTGTSIVINPTKVPEAHQGVFDFEQLKDSAVNNHDVNLAEALVAGGQLVIAEDIELQNLYMNSNSSLSIIIPNGITMQAKRIVMGNNDNITIQAGGRLIIYGDQGLYNVKNENLLIEAKEGKMGKFLFKPSVATNRHPHAIVELISKGHKDGEKYYWQRFGTPALRGIKIAEIQKIDHTFSTYYDYWDTERGKWVEIATAQFNLKPFVGFAMSSESPVADKKYAFPCDSLYGSINAPLKYTRGWNYYANSYTADIDIYAFLNRLMTLSEAYKNENGVDLIEGGVHVNDTTHTNYNWNNWLPISYQDILDREAVIETLSPMQAFVTKLLIDSEYKDTINYQTMVWNPAMGIEPNNDAPARRNMQASDYTKAVVVIANAEGEQKVTLRQSAQYSVGFDNGADMNIMKNNLFNIYANAEIGDMAQIATDNLVGQTLNIESNKAATYKMTFKNLRGETLAIRDNMTGSVINMTEGEEYFFSVAPGTTADRFEIVEAAKMPTDVEMLEAAPAKKGIYTLIGQYLGENFDVLPAGIYVVNGKKVVK